MMAEKATEEKMSGWKQHMTLIKALVVLIPMFILMIIPASGSYTPEIKLFFIITVCAILLWAVDLINMTIVSLMLPVAFILSKLATPEQVLAPWTQNLPYLVLGALIISIVFEQSGLMDRLAYWFITKSGGSYIGIILGLTTSGFVVSILVPGSLARVALYGGMAWGICKAMGFEKFSKATAGLMLGAYNAAVTTSFVVMTGVEPFLVMNNQLASIGIDPMTYMGYMKDNALLAVVWSYLVAAMIILLFKPEKGIENKSYFKEQYDKLGKMRLEEKKVALLLVILVILLATSSMHNIALGWIFIIMATVAFLPGINLGNEETIKRVNFPMIFFITATMAIGQVSTVTGAGSFIANAMFPLMSMGGKGFTVFATWVLGVGVNFVLTPFAAGATLTIPLADLANQLNISVYPLLYAFNHGLYEILLPYESTLPLLIYSFGVLSFKHFLKFFGAQMALNAVFIAVIAVPFWYLIGVL